MKFIPHGWNSGKGAAHRFLVDSLSYQGDDCLIWPFANCRGYGQFGYLGKNYYAHRYMCELKNGPAPSDIHEAAHSCGKNNCVNPGHLSWKTPTENMLDCREHGTHVRSRYGSAGKITRDQAATIRALKGIKKLREIAAEYGISEWAVSNIWVGKTHLKPSKLPPKWTPEDNAKLQDCISRGMTHKEIAAEIGRPHKAVATKAYRLGIKSQWIQPIAGGRQDG